MSRPVQGKPFEQASIRLMGCNQAAETDSLPRLGTTMTIFRSRGLLKTCRHSPSDAYLQWQSCMPPLEPVAGGRHLPSEKDEMKNQPPDDTTTALYY